MNKVEINDHVTPVNKYSYELYFEDKEVIFHKLNSVKTEIKKIVAKTWTCHFPIILENIENDRRVFIVNDYDFIIVFIFYHDEGAKIGHVYVDYYPIFPDQESQGDLLHKYGFGKVLEELCENIIEC